MLCFAFVFQFYSYAHVLFLAFSMGKCGPQPKSAKPQAPTHLPPHGKKDGNLRTPKHIAHPTGGKDMYTVQDIIAERRHHGQIQYLVHWQGYSETDDTWEPLAHLSDALEYVARWNEEKKKHNVEAELEGQKEKQKAQEGSSSSNADTPQTPPLCGKHFVKQLLQKVAKILLFVK